MRTNLSFKNFVNETSSDVGGRPPGNSQLVRQSSIYSLTLEEFQSNMGGIGKELGSMNMDELLRNIWSAEESQTMAAAAAAPASGSEGLQRQGSLTLPLTLSQKTVDEVWKDISKEYGGSGGSNNNMPQRQQTLGEITLEEFLFKAGVVREDSQFAGKEVDDNANAGFFSDISRPESNPGLGIGFQVQQNRGLGFSSNPTCQISLQSSNLPLNVNGVRSNHSQGRQQAQVQTQPPILPKQPNMGYVTQMPLQNSPGIRGGIVGIGDQGISGGLVGFGGVATGSPANQLSSDGIGTSNGDASSVSPVPYVFNGGLKGRRANGGMEKVVERRQRRMIKNRESAARSRARKQEYTMELEAEVAKLKAENQELQKKQAEIMEMQNDQAMEMINMQQGAKKQCLRRTQTGPW